MKKCVIGLISLCLILCSGCGKTVDRVVTVPVPVYFSPPAWLMEPTPGPEFPKPGSTNGDLLQWGFGTEDALGQCNRDKAALRESAGEASRGQ